MTFEKDALAKLMEIMSEYMPILSRMVMYQNVVIKWTLLGVVLLL